MNDSIVFNRNDTCVSIIREKGQKTSAKIWVTSNHEYQLTMTMVAGHGSIHHFVSHNLLAGNEMPAYHNIISTMEWFAKEISSALLCLMMMTMVFLFQ